MRPRRTGRPIAAASTGSMGALGDVLVLRQQDHHHGRGRDGRLRRRRAGRIVRQLHGQGQDPQRRYWFPMVGFNYRMTNIEAAIGLAQLERIDWHLGRRREIAAWYREELGDEPGIELSPQEPWARSAFWINCAVLDERRFGPRDRLMAALAERRDRDASVLLPAAHAADVPRRERRQELPCGRRPRAAWRQPAFLGDADARGRRLRLRAIARARTLMAHTPGVELAGYLGAAVGVGEAARRYLERCAVPACPTVERDVPLPGRDDARTALAAGPRAAPAEVTCNLLCLNPEQMVPYLDGPRCPGARRPQHGWRLELGGRCAPAGLARGGRTARRGLDVLALRRRS